MSVSGGTEVLSPTSMESSLSPPLFFIDTASDSTPHPPLPPPPHTQHSSSNQLTESFLRLEEPSPPPPTPAVDPSSRKLHHNINISERVYFKSDAKSLAESSKSGVSRSVGRVSSTPDLLASLMDSSSSSSNTRLASAMSKSLITPDFAQRHAVPSTQQSRREKKKAFKEQQDRSKGPNWFHMKRAEMTEEERRDLTVLKMRKSLDPKQFYKGDDMKGLPRFFQMGKVVEDKSDFYSSRIPKKQRRKSMADELLSDAKFMEYGSAKAEEVKTYEEERKKRLRQKKHMMKVGKKKGKR